MIFRTDFTKSSRPTPLRAALFIASVFLAALTSESTSAEQGDWTSWRGPQDLGSIEVGEYPAKFDANNVLWKTPLPGKGCSTPIILNQTIYVTCAVDGHDGLLAFDWSGKEKWKTVFGRENAGKHRNGSGSNASPVTDGEAIFVYYKSGMFAAVERDGTERWKTDLVERFGKDTLFWDHGTSPVLTKNHVIMTRMHNGESWLAAFDKKTGDMVWKEPRNYVTKMENDHGYTTPLVIDYKGTESLLVWGAEHLTVHNASDGKVVWTCGGFNAKENKLWPAIATPVIVDDITVIAYGRNDRKIPRLHGIRLDGTGDVTETNRVWKRTDIGTFVPSPVAYKGLVYLVRDRGEVECIDPKTGDNIWSGAFPKAKSNYYASPLIAGDKMYAPREDGVVFVASIADEKFELLSKNDMEESVIGSPIPSMNRIFIRGEEHLFCIAKE